MEDCEWRTIEDSFPLFIKRRPTNAWAIDLVEVAEYDRLAGYISSREDFCRAAAHALLGTDVASDTPTHLCLARGGRGGTDRMRQWYGLWKSVRSCGLYDGAREEWEEMEEEEGDFYFVGGAEIDFLAAPGILASEPLGSPSIFICFGGGDAWRNRSAVSECFAGYSSRLERGIPPFARYDVLPMLRAMDPDGRVMCLQSYGDGLCMYLFRRREK